MLASVAIFSISIQREAIRHKVTLGCVRTEMEIRVDSEPGPVWSPRRPRPRAGLIIATSVIQFFELGPSWAEFLVPSSFLPTIQNTSKLFTIFETFVEYFQSIRKTEKMPVLLLYVLVVYRAKNKPSPKSCRAYDDNPGQKILLALGRLVALVQVFGYCQDCLVIKTTQTARYPYMIVICDSNTSITGSLSWYISVWCSSTQCLRN